MEKKKEINRAKKLKCAKADPYQKKPGFGEKNKT